MSVLSKQFYVVVDNKGWYVRLDENMYFVHKENFRPVFLFEDIEDANKLATRQNASDRKLECSRKPYTVVPVTVNIGGTQ